VRGRGVPLGEVPLFEVVAERRARHAGTGEAAPTTACSGAGRTDRTTRAAARRQDCAACAASGGRRRPAAPHGARRRARRRRAPSDQVRLTIAENRVARHDAERDDDARGWPALTVHQATSVAMAMPFAVGTIRTFDAALGREGAVNQSATPTASRAPPVMNAA